MKNEKGGGKGNNLLKNKKFYLLFCFSLQFLKMEFINLDCLHACIIESFLYKKKFPFIPLSIIMTIKSLTATANT